MSTPAAFRATYSDWKLIRSRKVVQVVLEIPLEASGEAYDVLGGMPNPAAEIWCGVARLSSESEVMPHQRASTKLAGPDKSSPASDQAASPAAPVRAKIAWHEMAPPQQAGVLCNDPKFHQFLREEFPLKSASVRRDLGRDGAEMAATLVRSHCIVTSRSRIRNGHTSGRLWRELVEQYRAWEMAPQAGAA